MALNDRYLALDVFRGMTVCFMIIVNTPGSWAHIYGPLAHAPWHGFTPTDLVFPSFLFAVGNAMAFSMGKYQSLGESVFWSKTLKRTLLIFLIGLLLNWFPFYDFKAGVMKSLSTLRIMGVLQRIALCYFFASVIIHYGKKNFTLWFSAVLLAGYWLILYFTGDSNDPFSLAGYSGNALDFAVLGEKHLYRGEGVPFDPEGLLSTIPAVVNVTAGYLAGTFIKNIKNNYEKIARMMIAGAGLILIALAWDMVFPVNKKIWTSSFVLLTCGIDLFILCVLIYLIEILRREKWTYFFVVFGRNPLFIFVLSGILIRLLFLIPAGYGSLKDAIYKGFFTPLFSPVNASLLFALAYMLTCWLIGLWLDRKRIYIRV